jgi:hypothetical protein
MRRTARAEGTGEVARRCRGRRDTRSSWWRAAVVGECARVRIACVKGIGSAIACRLLGKIFGGGS